MNKVATKITTISTVLCILVLSCCITLFADDLRNIDLSTDTPTEQYFEGNLSYTSSGAFFEESISGAIIPVDMATISCIIESELPQINKRKGIPVHVKLSGHLSSQPNNNETPETYLVVKKVKEVLDSKRRIEPMIGTYKGNGQTLTISPNHTYTFQNKHGDETVGNWFLNSRNMMILFSEDSQKIMKINYKKKSLNSREDHPTIFTLSSNLSSR